MRWFLPVVAALAAAALIAGGASAKPKVRCDVMPFSFGEVPADIAVGPQRTRAEWMAMASATADCGPMGVLAIDVWEHASIVFDHSTDRVIGRAQILIDFTGAGVRVPFKGTVRGIYNNPAILHEIRASSPGGAKLGLRQTGLLDVGQETLDLDVSEGFFNIEALP
jgi:hypothetical protein